MSKITCFCESCLSSTYCAGTNEHRIVSNSLTDSNHRVQDLDYYLFSKNNLTITELMTQVSSRTMLDLNFVSMVQKQFNLFIVENHLQYALMNHINQFNSHGSSATPSISEIDQNTSDFVDFLIIDPMVSSTSLDLPPPRSSTDIDLNDNQMNDEAIPMDSGASVIDNNLYAGFLILSDEEDMNDDTLNND